MKENKGRFPWKDWARFEVVDIDGIVLQFADKPTFANRWFPVEKSTYGIAGRWNQPDDASKTLIERYPSEQAEPAPFVFGPEHIGRRVRHIDGMYGIVSSVDMNESEYYQLSIVWDGRGNNCWTYNLKGQSHCNGGFLVSLIESTPDQTPDLLARVEALEAQRGTDTALVVALTNRVASLSKEVFEMSESLEVTQSGDVSFDDLRFFVGETAPDPDPTAAKVEALKLLFEWSDGCNYMTVDYRDGHVWQWEIEPVNDAKVWKSISGDHHARRVGQIQPDPELSKILIKRHVEQ